MRQRGWERQKAAVGLVGLFWVYSLHAADDFGGSNAFPTLRPPRGEIPPTFWEQNGLWVVLGGILLVVVVVAAVIFLLRPKPPVVVPPAEQARRDLEPMLAQPETGAALSRVSQVLRHYVAAAFGMPPEETTTTEFCAAISGNEGIGAELAGEVSSFLRECDARKFPPTPPLPPLEAVSRALALIERAEARRAATATQSAHRHAQ